jgi:chorismate-pyruvate lyase
MRLDGRRAVPRLRGWIELAALALLLGRAADSAADGKPPEAAAPVPAWSNDFAARLEALALLETLNAELLSHDSATLTLDRWCDAHHLASPAKVVAVRDRDARKDATTEQRSALGVSATEPIRYRRVKLVCGAHVLSEADNWYVPSRLTAEMNHQLETSDIAFGRAVQALHFQRRTLSAKLLWSPLPQGWEVTGGALPDAGARTLAVPHAVLEHRAVLTLPDGSAISQVTETYTEQVLGFAQPRPMT